MENWRGEERGGNKREGRGGDPKSWFTPPMSEILKKCPDCITDLIGGGGNIDVCPGRQTPSRRHCNALAILGRLYNQLVRVSVSQ